MAHLYYSIYCTHRSTQLKRQSTWHYKQKLFIKYKVVSLFTLPEDCLWLNWFLGTELGLEFWTLPRMFLRGAGVGLWAGIGLAGVGGSEEGKSFAAEIGNDGWGSGTLALGIISIGWSFLFGLLTCHLWLQFSHHAY